MIIYGTTNDKLPSRLLRYFYEEPYSHVGIGFETLGLVIDSSTSGVKISRKKTWLKKNTPIDFIQFNISHAKELELFNKILDKIEGKKYDFSSYIYLSIFAIKYKLFKSGLPVINRLDNPNGILCTEVLDPIKKELNYYGINLDNIHLAMTTPYRLLEKMKNDLEAGTRKNIFR